VSVAVSRSQKQESRAIAGKPGDAAVIFVDIQHTGTCFFRLILLVAVEMAAKIYEYDTISDIFTNSQLLQITLNLTHNN